MEKMTCAICGGVENKYRFSKDGYSFYGCKKCTLTFVFPIPKNTEEVYGKNYYQNISEKPSFGYTDYDKDKEPMRKTFDKYLDRIESLNPQKTVFDVGAATGFFLDMAKYRGWETSGIELSSYAAEEARKRGHKVLTGKLPELSLNDVQGLVTMWDVLEHVDNPDLYIKSVSKLLPKTGLLVINTIDIGSLWARLLGRRWQLIVPPEHLFYFTKKSLVELLERNGFEILYVDRPSKRFSLAYICKILYRWQKLRIWQYLSSYFERSFWRKFTIPLNMRDNIFILAQKK